MNAIGMFMSVFHYYTNTTRSMVAYVVGPSYCSNLVYICWTWLFWRVQAVAHLAAVVSRVAMRGALARLRHIYTLSGQLRLHCRARTRFYFTYLRISRVPALPQKPLLKLGKICRSRHRAPWCGQGMVAILTSWFGRLSSWLEPRKTYSCHNREQSVTMQDICRHVYASW